MTTAGIKSVKPLKPRKASTPCPWWVPDQRGAALIGLFLLTAGILWVSAPARGEEPSEFFKAIAQAVVLTGFLAAIGFLFNASKGTSEANDRTDRVLDESQRSGSLPRDRLPEYPEGD